MTDHTTETETETTETNRPTDQPADLADPSTDPPAWYPDSAEWPPIDEPLGPADVTIDVPAAVARRAWSAFRQAAAAGYTDGFDTFLFNHTCTDWSITVDGEDLAVVLAREDFDVVDEHGAGETETGP